MESSSLAILRRCNGRRLWGLLLRGRVL